LISTFWPDQSRIVIVPYHGGRLDRKPTREASVRGKQILMTAAIALAVVVGFKVYEAKKG